MECKTKYKPGLVFYIYFGVLVHDLLEINQYLIFDKFVLVKRQNALRFKLLNTSPIKS